MLMRLGSWRAESNLMFWSKLKITREHWLFLRTLLEYGFAGRHGRPCPGMGLTKYQPHGRLLPNVRNRFPMGNKKTQV